MISLVTYPRTGSVFFYRELKRLNYKCEKTHSFLYDKNKTIITIARNPIDSISSIVAMEKFFFPEQDIYDLIDKRKQQYVDYCIYANSQSKIILNFEKMIADPQATLLEISLTLGIDINHSIKVGTPGTQININRVDTSKTLSDYQGIKDILSSQNNHLIEDLYIKLLNK